jgi:adenosylhomocysteine nucleosidase
MRVLVTFAVDAEFAPWLRLHRDWTVKDPVLHAYELCRKEIWLCVILTGMGCERGWDINAMSLWGSDFDICISSGLAGALNPEVRCGDVVVAEAICDYKGQKPLICDRELTELAVRQGAKRVAAFYTNDRMLVTPGEKKQARQFGDVVEMESRTIVGTAAHGFGWGARCAAIRGISDGAEESLPVDFNTMVTYSGDIDTRKLLRHALRNPRTLPGLISFGRRSHSAAKKLVDFLDEYVISLGKGTITVPSAQVAAR